MYLLGLILNSEMLANSELNSFACCLIWLCSGVWEQARRSSKAQWCKSWGQNEYIEMFHGFYEPEKDLARAVAWLYLCSNPVKLMEAMSVQ